MLELHILHQNKHLQVYNLEHIQELLDYQHRILQVVLIMLVDLRKCQTYRLYLMQVLLSLLRVHGKNLPDHYT